MADQSVPTKNQAYVLATSFVDQADANVFRNLPTVAVGDARVNTYDGAVWSGWGNTTNALAQNGERGVVITLTASEMDNDIVHVVFHDPGAEWQDQGWILHPTDNTFDALAAAIAALGVAIAGVPAAVWTYVNRTLTSLSGVCSDIWSCARRTLTSTFTSLRSPLRGDEISILRGDTLDFDATALGDISTRANVWFTVKDDKDHADTASDIQIDENVGLLYIMGTAGVAANGSITVTDAAAGDLTVFLEAIETAKLSDKGRFWYDIQWIDNAGVVQTLTKGRAHIIGDITRATS